MNKHRWLSLCVLAAAGMLHGQAPSREQVRTVLSRQDDTVKVIALSDLCFAYRRVNSDSALLFGTMARDISVRLRYAKGEAMACNDMAIVHMDRNAYGTADSLLRKALIIRMHLNDSVGMGAIHNKLGIIYQEQFRLEEALLENMKALAIFERTGPANYVSVITQNIAIIQFNLRRYEEALVTHQQAAAFRMEQGDDRGLAESQGNIANVQLFLGDTSAAIANYKEAIAFFRKNDLPDELAIQLHNLAGVELAQGRVLLARAMYEEALVIREGLGDRKAMASTLTGLANAYSASGRTLDAKQVLLKALRYATEVGATHERAQALLQLSRVYSILEHGDSTLWYHERYAQVTDSVFDRDMATRLADMETRYETARKEREILDQRAVMAEQEVEILALEQRRRTVMIIGAAAMAVLVVSALLVMQVQRRRSRAIKDAALLAERDAGLQNMMLATEAERKRIASELHDGIGQQLTGLKFRMEDISDRIVTKVPEETQQVRDLMGIIEETGREVRGIAHSMMPRALKEVGLVPALEDMLRNSLSHKDLHYTFDHFAMEERLAPEVEVGLFRVAQELVSNVLKHAGATNVSVQLLRNKGHVVMLVEDDGKGMDEHTPGNGLGMRTMRDRIRLLNGTLDMESGTHKGTLTTVRIPLSPNT